MAFHSLDPNYFVGYLYAEKKDGENSKEGGAEANDKNGKAASPESKRNKRRLVLEVGKIPILFIVIRHGNFIYSFVWYKQDGNSF